MQTRVEGVSPHAVIDNPHTFSARNFSHSLGDIFSVVSNDVVRACGHSGVSFRVRRHCANHLTTAGPNHLTQKQPDATGSGVNQGSIPRHYLVDAGHEIVGGKALQHHSGSCLQTQGVRNEDSYIRWHGDELGVTSEVTRPRHPITREKLGDCSTDRPDDSRSLETRGVGKSKGVKAFTLVDINEVDPCRVDINDDVTLATGRLRHLRGNEDLRPSGLGHNNCSHRSPFLG